MRSAEERAAFWTSFIRALEAEPRNAQPLRGASGLLHPVVALGVDETRRRILIVSGDPDGRSAALAQADLQAAYPDQKVILARPIIVNLAKVAEGIVGLLGKTSIGPEDLKRLAGSKKPRKKVINQKLEELTKVAIIPAFRAIDYASVDIVAAFQDAIRQLSHLQLEPPTLTSGPTTATDAAGAQIPTLKLGPLLALDPAEIDRQMGVCSVPLYEFSDAEAETLLSGGNIDQAREHLRTHEIFQYFFPPADHTALALVDRRLVSPATLGSRLSAGETLGHPFGALELIPQNTPLEDVIDALKERGYCVEGDVSFELTETGRTTRASVRFKPREGFFSKLSNVFSVKIDLGLKDFISKPPLG